MMIEKNVVFASYSQIMDVEGVLVDVGCISSSCYASGGCQIATISPHSLHYKHSSLGPWCRLLDFVATLNKTKTFFFKFTLF